MIGPKRVQFVESSEDEEDMPQQKETYRNEM